MARPERFHRGHELIEIIQAADRRGDHLNQLALLFAQIRGKQFAQFRRDRKQSVWASGPAMVVFEDRGTISLECGAGKSCQGGPPRREADSGYTAAAAVACAMTGRAG